MIFPWDITIVLVLIAFALPFIYLHKQMKELRQQATSDDAEIKLLRRFKTELEVHIEKDKSLFLNALGVAFLLMRPSGRLIMANKEAETLLGMKAKRSTNLLYELDPRHPMHQAIAQALASEEATSSMVKMRIDGEDKVYRLTATHLQNIDQHIGIVCHDMTEEQRTMMIRREFITNASHELRTPLTIIRGYLESFIEDPDFAKDPLVRDRAFIVMKKHSDRIVRLIEDMLTISRLENTGSEHLRMRDFELHEIIDDVYVRLERMMQQQGATCHIQIQPERIGMYGDPFYWTQILFNLVENALKNNPQEGLKVDIKVHLMEGDQVRIAVIDNGRGISGEAMPYIFQRFYRADETGKIKGTGLGLSIVRNAVEAHGGSIVAESTAYVRTAFVITAPRRVNTATHTP